MNTDYCVSEVMATTTVPEGVPTNPARAMELLEELYQLYNIDLIQPLHPCILRIHLFPEFIDKKLNHEVEESKLLESLIAWMNKNDVDIATKTTSREDLLNSETTNEETPL